MKAQVIDLNNLKEVEVTEEVQLSGLFIGHGEDSLNSTLLIKHKLPNLKSRISIKAVLYDDSKFDFQGVLQIDKGAENTDTYLKVDCLIMSDKAFARAVPSLEIKESAVKAGHGATIGYLDQDLLYYLKSKGLSPEQAEDLIVEAFINS